MSQLTLVLPHLYPKQKQAIFAPERYSVIEASTKAGKTVACMVWIVAQAWNKGKEGRNWWWVAPTLPVAKIAFRRIRRMLARTDPGKTIWKCNDSECYITLHNGACIWFKGSDVPDSLYGEDVYGAVIDEASRCKDESWYAIRSTITATQGDVRVIGNVKGRKNWAYMLGRRALAGDPGMAYFKLTAYDAAEAGIFPMSEIESAKRDLPEHVFRELYLAEPADDGGNPFGIGAIARCVKPMSSRDPISFGVDLAKSNDWTWVIGLDEAGDVCVSERWQSDWGQTRNRVIQLIGNTPTLADSTGVGDPIVEDLCRECVNVEGFKFSNNSKQQIMEGLASGIQRGEVGFPDGILRSELEAFEYQYTNGRVKYSAPDGQHDDGVCALALAYSRLRNPGFQLGALSSLGIVDVI